MSDLSFKHILNLVKVNIKNTDNTRIIGWNGITILYLFYKS